jgi:pyruvate, water dikinase
VAVVAEPGRAGCTRPLAELRRADEPAFGAKSASLGELLCAGIQVPPGFALSTHAFSSFLTENELEREIADRLARLATEDMESVRAASDAIGRAMRAAPLPDGVRDEVAERYDELADAAGEPQPAVAVRSSATGEDSAEATFAGQQETYLWVRGVDAVCEAIRNCWISLYSPTAVTYRARVHDSGEAAMGVTVQLMVDAEVSGVMFTCNPVSGDPSMVAINASWGLGLAVVGGEVTPDDYLVSKVTREVVREQVHDKLLQYVPAPDGDGAVEVEVAPERRGQACLDHLALAALVDVARRVERYFGSHQDVEWAIARGARPPDGLFVVQSRPVTGVQKREKAAPLDAMSLVMSTFGAGRSERSA